MWINATESPELLLPLYYIWSYLAYNGITPVYGTCSLEGATFNLETGIYISTILTNYNYI